MTDTPGKIELLDPIDTTTGDISVFSSPKPFGDLQASHIVPEGNSINQILKLINMELLAHLDAHIFVDDLWIERSKWAITIPRADQIVSIKVVPAGGENSSKNALRAVAMIAVLAIAIAAPYALLTPEFLLGGTTGVKLSIAAITAGVTLIGSLAVNGLIPLSTAQSNDNSISTEKYYTVTGIRNQANPYGPVQRVFGKMRLYPTYAALPYTENYDRNSYLRLLFAVGMGEYELSEFKIGETALTEYEDYTVKIGYKSTIDKTIYPNSVYEEVLSIELLQANNWEIQTTQINTEEIGVDLVFPAGYYTADDDDGHIRQLEVSAEVQYYDSIGATWTHFPRSPRSSLESQGGYGNVVGRFSWTFVQPELTAGQYDVRVRKTSTDWGDGPSGGDGSIRIDEIYWVALRSINYAEPVNIDNCLLVALKIRANEQLNGMLDSFNFMVEAKVPIWNGSSWSSPATTRSPAWAYTEVLRGATDDSNTRPIADSKIDGDYFATWASQCITDGYKFDAVVDQRSTVFEVLKNIAATGRADYAKSDEKYTVLQDLPQATARQHFSPLNSWGANGRKVFNDIPHAFRIRFINEEAAYQQDEMTVYRDGYSAGSATMFETMEFWGVVNSDHIWKLARYHMAVAQLRPEIFERNVDIEHLVCTRGQRVRLTDDVILVGLGQARIKTVSLDGADCDGVTMDNPISISGTASYGAQIRLSDMSMVSATIATPTLGSFKTINFNPVIPAVDVPETGDIIFFGISGLISKECIITKIESGEDLTAKLTLSDYNTDDIISACAGTIPAHDPGITIPVPVEQKVPLTPVIKSITTDFTATPIGTNQVPQLNSRINFTPNSLKTPGWILNKIIGTIIGLQPPADNFQCQYRYSLTSTFSPWYQLPSVGSADRHFNLLVENEQTYDFKIRAVTKYGQTSSWATSYNYTVDYQDSPPHPIFGLSLVQGGSTFEGQDIDITWTLPTDLYKVHKNQIEIYKTAAMTTVLRTEYTDKHQNFYSYLIDQNKDDNSGIPVDAITFKTVAISYFGTPSTTKTSLSVTAATPTPPTGFGLIQGGSEFNSKNCELIWDAATNVWGLKEYKVEAYKTSALTTVLRTKLINIDQTNYSYTFEENLEDNAGTPETALTFRLYAYGQHRTPSAYTALDVTNPIPANIAGLSAIPAIGGVDFLWTANSNDDFNYHAYQLQVASEGWEPDGSWFRTNGNRAQRILTDAEKTANGGTANIQIRVKAFDKFGQESATAQTANANCFSLAIEPADITDIAGLSSHFTDIPIIQLLTFTDNDPDTNSISWSACDIFLNGTGYSIAASVGTDKTYVYWKDLAGSFAATTTNPGEISGWKPQEDFIIATNTGGLHQKAWLAMANQVIGSAWIKDAAITNAKILDLNAAKITAGYLNVDRIEGGTINLVAKAADFDTANIGTSIVWTNDDAADAAQADADTGIANAATADGKAVDAQADADTGIANAATADGKAVAAQGTADGVKAKTDLGFDAFGNLITKAIPASNAAPSGAGLYMGADYLGYYDSSNWKTYMDSSGNFYLGGATGKLQWDGSALSIEGSLVITGTDAITVESDGNITLESGGDLILQPHDSSPSKIIFEDSGDGSNHISIQRSITVDALQILPDVDNTCHFNIGVDFGAAIHPVSSIQMFSQQFFRCSTWVDINNSVDLVLDTDNNYAWLSSKKAGNTCSINLDSDNSQIVLTAVSSVFSVIAAGISITDGTATAATIGFAADDLIIKNNDPGGKVFIENQYGTSLKILYNGISLTDGTATEATIIFDSDDLLIANNDPGGMVRISAEKAATGQSSVFTGYPDAGSYIYYAGTVRFATLTAGIQIQDGISNFANIVWSSDDLVIENTETGGQIFIETQDGTSLRVISTGISITDGTATAATIGFTADDLIIKNNDAGGQVMIETQDGSVLTVMADGMWLTNGTSLATFVFSTDDLWIQNLDTGGNIYIDPDGGLVTLSGSKIIVEGNSSSIRSPLIMVGDSTGNEGGEIVFETIDDGTPGDSWHLDANQLAMRFHTGGNTYLTVDATNGIHVKGGLYIIEQAAASADIGGRGQIWVKANGNGELWFTDDVGADHQLHIDDVLKLSSRLDPTEPATWGDAIIWVANGTVDNKGDNGDIMAAVNIGGSTKYITLFDYSAEGDAW